MKLIADVHIPFLKGVLEPFFEEIQYIATQDITPQTVRDADALLIRTRTNCNESLLSESKVKFIGSATIGFDHIDTDYCDKTGIKWVNSPGCNSDAVLQWVLSALFQIQDDFKIDYSGKVIGIVGVGNVGRRVANAARFLGFKVLCCDPPRVRNESLTDFVDFETITKESDIISFHVPLKLNGENATWHMANEKFFAEIKQGAIIINSSRGEVIDSNELLKAIQTKITKASAIDVWENEPNISAELIASSIIATPHIAGYSLEGKVLGTKMVVDKLSEFFNLGLHPWLPNPNPLTKKVLISHPESVKEIISKTYDIKADDIALRFSLDKFENLRNTYNYRRDFTGHEVVADNNTIIDVISKLGFQVNNK
jgi:erythronate-4-phosphate dehydrogenase